MSALEAHIYEQRISEIVELMINGYSRTYILQYGSKWGLGNRAIDDMIYKARLYFVEANNASRDEKIALARERLEKVISECTDKEKLVRLKALQELHKIEGLHTENINITGEIRTVEIPPRPKEGE